jgi:hypothetical protein
MFLNCSTCFGRHSAHHQELKNCNCSLWFCIRLWYALHAPIVMKSGSLNLLEPSGPVQACNGIALPFYTSHGCLMGRGGPNIHALNISGVTSLKPGLGHHTQTAQYLIQVVPSKLTHNRHPLQPRKPGNYVTRCDPVTPWHYICASAIFYF